MNSPIPSPPSTVGSRLKYRFDNALSRGPSVVIGWLGFIIGAQLDIRLLDHFIVGDGEPLSLAERGLM